MDPKVSIIMPVYNAEAYIRATLDTVRHQTYQNLEIICVDDGSKDGSVALLQQMASEDSRITVLQQQNQFAGIARNNGLDHATGKYVMFLDSDDLFEKNMVAALVSKAEKHQTDIIVFGFWRFVNTPKRRRPVRCRYQDGMLCSSADLKDNVFQITRSLPWDKFLRMDYVRQTGIRYHGTRVNNDIYFNRTIVTEADRILFLGKRFVNYKIDNKASLQGHLNKHCTDFLVGNSLIFDRMQEKGTIETFRSSFDLMILDDIVLHMSRIGSYAEFEKIASEIRQQGFLSHVGITADNPTLQAHSHRDMFLNILEGSDQEAMFCLFSALRASSVQKSSPEYRIGHKVTKLAGMSLD